MNLDDLLAGLEKQAEFPPAKDESKSEGGEGKDGKDAKAADKKDDKSSEKDEKDGQEKSAAFKSGSDLAAEIMEKLASVKIDTNTNQGENMNKQASEAGKALAQALLKKAGVGDVITTNGITPGTVPHKSIQDQAAQKAEHDMIIQATPGTDGLGNGGTINQIFDAIVADAMAKGVKDENMTGGTAPAEGAQVAAGAPNQNPMVGPENLSGESREKTAAVVALVNSGYDFDDAVSMVKEASDALEAEHETHVKQAAFNELLAQGVSFADAAQMVKAASQGQNIDMQKQAAVNQLLESGVDFDVAIDLVNAKANELFGA